MYFGFDTATKRAFFSYKGRQFFYKASSAREAWYEGYRMYRARRVSRESELD